MSTGRSGGSSTPTTVTTAGSFGDSDYSSSRRLSQDAEGLNKMGNVYDTPLQNMLLNPQYGAKDPNESALINSLLDATAGRTANRGLGAPTENSMASAIAPSLITMRNQNIQNLLGAQAGAQAGKANDMKNLLELIGYAMPQTLMGNTSNESSKTSGLFCWVAREVYGETNPKWYLFRDWVLCKSPNWFFKLYSKYGERFAKFISDKPTIKSWIRSWMDTKVGGNYGLS